MMAARQGSDEAIRSFKRAATASNLSDPQALAIRAILNGEAVQDSNTASMVFGVAEIIEYVTRTITLEPGDLIATGTPAGVGAFRKPPLFMQPADALTKTSYV